MIELPPRPCVLTACRERAALAALIGAAVTVLWLRFNAPPPRNGLVLGDLNNYFYPLGQLVARRLADGELPLWNPHACSGIPLLAAAQVAALYPGTWLSAILPVHQALPLLMFIECCLGGWFASLLFRAWGLNLCASAAGGILFVFACFLGQTFWPPQASTILWLPWLLLCVERLVTAWRWRWWIGLALGTALQVLAGFFQFAVYTFYLLVPYAALRLVEGSRISGLSWSAALRGASSIGLAYALGLALAAPQLLPTLELVQHGTRAGPLRPGEVHYLRGISAGAALHNVLDVSPKIPALDFGRHGYLGMPTLIALVLGVIAGYRRRLVWFFVTVASLSLLLSDGFLGWGRHLYALYAKLPTGAMFRQPERLRLLALFSAIAIASMGFNEFGNGPMRERSRSAFRAAVVAAILTTGLIVVLAGWAPAWRAGLTLVGLGIAVRWAQRPVVRSLGQALVLVLLVVDLTQAMARIGSWRSFPKGWSESFHFLGYTAIDGREFERLREQVGLNRLSVQGMLPLTGAVPIDGAYRESCYETLLPRAWGTLNAKIAGKAETKVGGPRQSNRYLFDIDPVRFATFYDVAGVRLIVRAATPDPAPPGMAAALLQTYQTAQQTRPAPWPTLPPGVTIERLANDDALDRAYFVNRFAVVSMNDALDHVVSGKVDFHSMVLLDRDPGAAARGAHARYHPATILSYEPERVVIDVDAPTAGFVVLTDTDYPGWRARVDAEDAEIFRANGLYRAVPTTRGRHRVTFEYRPASLAWGFRIAAVSAGLLALLPAVALARRR